MKRTTNDANRLREVELGRSVLDQPITAFLRTGKSRSAPTALILGGMHGNEPKSVYVCRRLIDLLATDPRAGAGVTWVVAPLVNSDGFASRQRKNARGVDINRNFPTQNWGLGSARSRMYGGPSPASEPETMAVMYAIRRFKPAWIVTVHSIDRGRFCNNYDGPGRGLAMKMRRHNKYPVRGSIGYPTPGSFGTWAGIEHGIPTITLELPSHHSAKQCWADSGNSLLCNL